jgi:hypothetical protein
MRKIVIANIALPLMLLLGASGVIVPPTANAAVGIDINIGPPPPREEVVPPPRAGYVWAPGYWEWRGHRHEWHGGYWMREHRGSHWVPAHWDRNGPRYHFEPGHWER